MPNPDLTDQELFWGADQYDFSMMLRAEGLECFWHFAHRGERFYLNFMVRPEHMEAFILEGPQKGTKRCFLALKLENIKSVNTAVCV